MRLAVKIGAKQLPNPVGIASGTVGYGSEYEKLIDLDKLGALYTKAVTPEMRPGNCIPRLVETPSGLINSIGLANVGLNNFVKHKLPYLSALRCPVIVNVAGSRQEDYLSVVRELEERNAIVWGYELNVSCPNVKEGGIAFGTDPEATRRLTESIRRITGKPLIVKLTPNVTDITVTARAAEEGGADGISCINTVVGMVIDIERKRSVIPGGTAGLSGPAIRPIGVAAVYRVSRSVSIPVIGIGGISSWEDGVQYLLAGASALQLGTAVFIDPAAPQKVLEGVTAYADREGIGEIAGFHKFLP
ncbi:MAG: dihydroorotate dehydrogenase [Spirochaetia bacterium]